MTMLPLTTYFDLALPMLMVPGGLDVVDTTYNYEDGVDVQEIDEERNIAQIAIDPHNSRMMQHMFGGSVSDGDMLLYTKESLYIADAYGPDEIQRQTFFNFCGYGYRVAAISPWALHLGFSAYLAKRHLKQDKV